MLEARRQAGPLAGAGLVDSEVSRLMAAVPHEDDRAALLRRLDDGSACAADRARLAGCSVGTLRTVARVEAMV